MPRQCNQRWSGCRAELGRARVEIERARVEIERDLDRHDAVARRPLRQRAAIRRVVDWAAGHLHGEGEGEGEGEGHGDGDGGR